MKPIKLESVEAPMPHSGRAAMICQVIQSGMVFYCAGNTIYCVQKGEMSINGKQAEIPYGPFVPREGDELFDILRRPEDGLCSYMLQSTGTPIRVLARFNVQD